MRGRTRLILVAAALVATGALALSLSHAKEKDGYTVVLLSNSFGASDTYANDINDSGRIVGALEHYANSAFVKQEALLWKKWDSDPIKLDMLKDHTGTCAMAINNTGESCGYSTDWWWYQNAVIWDKDGKATDMHPDLGFWWSQMWDINQYGDAVGMCYGPGRSRAFITPVDGDAELLELDTKTYVQSWPYEINKDGVVVGFARYDAGSGWGPVHACYWDEDGDFEDMHDDIEKDLGFEVVASKAWALSDKGEIGGIAVVEMSGGLVTDGRAFVWTEDDGFDWVDSDGSDLSVIGGGGGKYMVGVVDGTLQNFSTATAAIWTRTKVKGKTVWDLELLPMPEGHTGMATWRANTSGRVVGVSVDKKGHWHAVYVEK